jgi:hypothetical protein
MSSVEKHEPGGRFYFGILPTVLSMVYLARFAEVLARFSRLNLDVGRHGGRHQDVRIIRDFD